MLYRESFFDYIFGMKRQVKNAAIRLGFPVPKRFGVRELVGRCNRVIKELEKENDGRES
jgi:hypothetical protein